MPAPALGDLFASCAGFAGTPAETYLVARQAHAPELQPLPNILWLPRDAGLAWPDHQNQPSGPVIPAGAAGAVVYVYGDRQGRAVAADLDLLTADGRLREPRTRWTFGKPTGAAFLAPMPGVEEWDPSSIANVHLAEGPVDVLRLRAVWAEWLRAQTLSGAHLEEMPFHMGMAAGGSGNVSVWLPDGCCKLVIHADGDIGGQEWAVAVRERVRGLEWQPTVHIKYYPKGKDPAS